MPDFTGLEWMSVSCACNYPRNSFWQFFGVFLQKYPKTKRDLGALPALYFCIPRGACPGINLRKGFLAVHYSRGTELRQNSACSHCWLPNIHHRAPDFNSAGSVRLQARVCVLGGGRQRMWSPRLDGLALGSSSMLGTHTLCKWKEDCVMCCGILGIAIRMQTGLDLNTKDKIKNRNGKGQDPTGVQPPPENRNSLDTEHP